MIDSLTSFLLIERRKMFVGQLDKDQVMPLKIGEQLVITTDQNVIGT
jgi:hypothetical protein